jgi:hypothetical protein
VLDVKPYLSSVQRAARLDSPRLAHRGGSAATARLEVGPRPGSGVAPTLQSAGDSVD